MATDEKPRPTPPPTGGAHRPQAVTLHDGAAPKAPTPEAVFTRED